MPFFRATSRPRTLLFCTAFAEDERRWARRYRRWLEAVRALPIAVDRVLIVDDGSPVLPGWDDVALLREGDWDGREPEAGTVLFHHARSLGRRAVFDFPGWYRSYAWAAAYAERFGYEKVIHLESDAYLLTPRIQARVDAIRRGWTGFWCPRHRMPEMAIQVIAGRHRRRWAALARRPYEGWLKGRLHERAIPWTRIERRFVGDRYGETGGIVPPDADYATQTLPDLPPDAYWWLPDAVARLGH